MWFGLKQKEVQAFIKKACIALDAILQKSGLGKLKRVQRAPTKSGDNPFAAPLTLEISASTSGPISGPKDFLIPIAQAFIEILRIIATLKEEQFELTSGNIGTILTLSKIDPLIFNGILAALETTPSTSGHKSRPTLLQNSLDIIKRSLELNLTSYARSVSLILHQDLGLPIPASQQGSDLSSARKQITGKPFLQKWHENKLKRLKQQLDQKKTPDITDIQNLQQEITAAFQQAVDEHPHLQHSLQQAFDNLNAIFLRIDKIVDTTLRTCLPRFQVWLDTLLPSQNALKSEALDSSIPDLSPLQTCFDLCSCFHDQISLALLGQLKDLLELPTAFKLFQSDIILSIQKQIQPDQTAAARILLFLFGTLHEWVYSKLRQDPEKLVPACGEFVQTISAIDFKPNASDLNNDLTQVCYKLLMFILTCRAPSYGSEQAPRLEASTDLPQSPLASTTEMADDQPLTASTVWRLPREVILTRQIQALHRLQQIPPVILMVFLHNPSEIWYMDPRIPMPNPYLTQQVTLYLSKRANQEQTMSVAYSRRFGLFGGSPTRESNAKYHGKYQDIVTAQPC